MKKRFTILLLTIAFLQLSTHAQTNLANGGFERWRLKEFKCCGRNIDSPWDWGMTENLTGLNYNKFVFRETDSNYVHSGLISTRLFSDTTYLNNLVLVPGIISYGNMADSASASVTIATVVKPGGFPISSNPSMLSFYMMMAHQETDTASYVYVFTKWNLELQKEDTLAYSWVDIPDNIENMSRWLLFTDTIKYLMQGTADTVRLMFIGGRFGNSALQGNATFLDDVSFYYPTTGLVSLDGEPVLQVYPNPASGQMNIKTGQYNSGNVLALFDLTGRVVKTVDINTYSTSTDIQSLAMGEYIYVLQNKSGMILCRGKFTVTN